MSNPKQRPDEEVDPSVARQIDENLKRLYQESAEEELPESLGSLLAALRSHDNQNHTG